MDASYFALNIAFLSVATLLGMRLGRAPQRIWLPAAIVSAFLALGRAYLAHRPEIEVAIFAWRDYPYFGSWHLYFVSAVFVIAARQLPRLSDRKAVLALTGVVAFYLLTTSAVADFALGPRPSGVVGSDGVCKQTTGFSCEAAAAVSLLHLYGIDVTEDEMARLSLITFVGAGVPGLYRGLRIAVEPKGYRVSVRRLSWNGLASVRFPFLAQVSSRFPIDHMVCVLAVTPERLLVIDPSLGKHWLARDSFLERWRGVIVVVEPPRTV